MNIFIGEEHGLLTGQSVYGDMKGTPSYVKRAFERAYEMLEKYDATDKVSLFYNDYDTYFEVEGSSCPCQFYK